MVHQHSADCQIEWSDGKVDVAETWGILMDVVRLTQMRDMNEEEFRWAMAKRAYRWSKTKIDVGAEAEEFFHELERAGMLVILDPEEVT